MPYSRLFLAALVAAAPCFGASIDSTWGLDVLEAILQDKQNVSLRIDDWKLNGFERDLFSEYRTDSVLRRAPRLR
jgi:hypothetical protein